MRHAPSALTHVDVLHPRAQRHSWVNLDGSSRRLRVVAGSESLISWVGRALAGQHVHGAELAACLLQLCGHIPGVIYGIYVVTQE